MYKCIQFDIEAMEQLKLGKFERDANNSYSFSYIPGSVIKGAVVWGLVGNTGCVPKDILNGKTIFYNAYPLIDGNPAIPMLKGYIGDKQEIRSNKEKNCIVHSFNQRKENCVPFKSYEFVTGDINNEKSLLGYNPGKIENLHINKKDALNSMEKSKMFRYEAIRKGECFRAYIRIPDEYFADLLKVLSQDCIYFGGSRGSGYGKCIISNIKEIPSIHLYESDLDIVDELYIYFLSDAILYYNGRVNTYIPENELKEILGIKGNCEYVNSYSSLGIAASYNTQYRTNTICYSAIEKGSVIKYKVEEKVDAEKIKKLSEEGVGLRREDGYGQVAVLKKISDNVIVSEYKKDDIQKVESIELTDDDKSVMNIILHNIFKSRSKLQVEKIVLDTLKDREKPKGSLQSQIGKLLNIFQNGLYKTEDSFKKYLGEYLQHMQEKKNKVVWHKLYDFNFSYTCMNSNPERLSLQKLLLDFINGKSNSIFIELENVTKRGVAMGNYKFPDESNIGKILYNLKMEFFISLFEYCIRMKEVIV